MLVKGSGIILLPVYLKLMTQQEFGLYGYLFAIISTFSLVFNLGLYVAQSKLYHTYNQHQQGEMFFTIHVMLFFFMASLISLIFLFDIDYPAIKFLFNTPFNYDTYRPTVILMVVVSVYSSMLINFFLTTENIRQVQFFNISRIVFINCFVLLALFWNVDEDHALVRLKYGSIIEFLIIVFFSFQYLKRMKFRFDVEMAKRSLNIGFPIVISALLGVFINLSDRYFIDLYGTLENMSVYNLALSIAGVIPFIFASFQNIWLPRFLKEKDLDANREKFRIMLINIIIIFTGLSVLIIVTVQSMILLNFIGQEYQAVIFLLPIVLLTSIVSSLTTLFSNYLVYFDKLYFVILIGFPIAIIGILLNIWLVPLFNLYGAAIASLGVNACYLCAYIYLAKYFGRKKLAK